MLNALFDVVILSQEEVCNCTESHPVLIGHGDSMSCNDEYTLFWLSIINSKHAKLRSQRSSGLYQKNVIQFFNLTPR